MSSSRVALYVFTTLTLLFSLGLAVVGLLVIGEEIASTGQANQPITVTFLLPFLLGLLTAAAGTVTLVLSSATFAFLARDDFLLASAVLTAAACCNFSAGVISSVCSATLNNYLASNRMAFALLSTAGILGSIAAFISLLLTQRAKKASGYTVVNNS